MRMNSNIILQSRAPDVVNALARGQQAGQAARQDNVFREYGAGAANGDQNALNALASVDPRISQGLQQGQQAMRATDQRMQMLSDQEKRSIEAHAMKMSAAERDAQAQRIEAGLMRGVQFHQAGDLQSLNAVLAQSGEQPIRSLEEFPAVAAKYKEVFDTLKGVSEFNAGPKDPAAVQALKFRASQAGLTPDTPEYAQFMLEGGRKQDSMRITNTPDGGFSVETGAATSATPPKMTVDAAKNTGFLIRTREANEVLSQLEGQGTRFTQQNLDSVPLGLGNFARDEDFQKYDQARRDFVNAILRRESGAVIADSEFENANKQYFPVPGDGPDVIAQKRKNRENAVRGIEIGSGEGAAFVDSQDAAAGASSPFAGMARDDVLGFDISNASIAEIEAWNKRMDELEAEQ